MYFWTLGVNFILLIPTVFWYILSHDKVYLANCSISLQLITDDFEAQFVKQLHVLHNFFK